MTKDDYGHWEITLPAQNGQPAIPHDSKVKVLVASPCDLQILKVAPDIHGSSE